MLGQRLRSDFNQRGIISLHGDEQQIALLLTQQSCALQARQLLR
jgi:hypothetical protein